MYPLLKRSRKNEKEFLQNIYLVGKCTSDVYSRCPCNLHTLTVNGYHLMSKYYKMFKMLHQPGWKYVHSKLLEVQFLVQEFIIWWGPFCGFFFWWWIKSARILFAFSFISYNFFPKTVQQLPVWPNTIFVFWELSGARYTDTRADPGKDKGHVTRSWISLLKGIMLIQ